MSSSVRVVRVWDLPVRLFHWLIVALVAAAYVTWRLNWMVWHGWIGDITLALLLFRLLWGFFGSETARFTQFLASPRIVFEHLKYGLLREPDRQVGHNPAGGWMVLLLLALLFAQTLTGIYVANDIADVGPLTGIVPARPPTRSTPLTRSYGKCCWRRSRFMWWRSSVTPWSRDKTWCAPCHRYQDSARTRGCAAHGGRGGRAVLLLASAAAAILIAWFM